MRNFILYFLLTFIGIGSVLCLQAQVAVSGTVADSSGKPLSSSSVTLKKSNGIVLAFAISNANGAYQIQFNNASVKDTLYLEANSIGFIKLIIPVTTPIMVANFSMKSTIVRLPNVTVTNTRLLQKEGDTLNYNVFSFSNKQDRTLEDVLKKMPGVEVADNGQISIGGKPINRFYIDGDNLLDGKYNIATKGIPNDMVSKVQILENHQPVNALKELEKSESAAINIVLKDKARMKIMGTGDASIGSPNVYNISSNALLFQKRVKFINYIKMNNIGVDVGDEPFNFFENDNAQPVNILNSDISNPDLLKKRYMFNEVGLVNANNLINLKNEYQFRINAYYLWDKQYQSNQFSSAYYLVNDTILYTEKQFARSIKNKLNTQFSFSTNKKNYYLNNVTVIENVPSQILTELQSNTNSNIFQHLNGTATIISNTFEIIKKFTNGHVLQAYSSFNNINNPASLQVEPGLYPAQFNNNINYSGLIQQVSVPSFNTENYLSFGKVSANIQQQYRIGINYQNQQLNSLLESQQISGSIAPVADSFVNQLKWHRLKTYFQSDFTFSNGPVLLRMTLPATFQEIKYSGSIINNQFSNLLIQPRMYVKWIIGKEAYINLIYNYGDTYGGISQVYDGYVMRGYRDFYSNGILLNETKSHLFNGAYVIRDALKIFFLTVGGSYATNYKNTINDLSISSLLQKSKLIPYENHFKTSSLYSSISKYVFPLMSTFSAKINFQRSVGNQLQNGDLLETKSDSYFYTMTINTRFSSFFNVTYSGTYNTFESKTMSGKYNNLITSPKVERWQHEFAANFTLSSNFYFKLSGDNYRYLIPKSQNNHYTFADAYLTYKLNKFKTDIEISMTNIAGIDSYSTASLTNNSILFSNFQIRPRMVMVKSYFRF